RSWRTASSESTTKTKTDTCSSEPPTTHLPPPLLHLHLHLHHHLLLHHHRLHRSDQRPRPWCEARAALHCSRPSCRPSPAGGDRGPPATTTTRPCSGASAPSSGSSTGSRTGCAACATRWCAT